jgi:hypothetical protein
MSIWKKLLALPEIERARPFNGRAKRQTAQGKIAQPPLDLPEAIRFTSVPDELQAAAEQFVMNVYQALPKLDFLMVGELASERSLSSISTNIAFEAATMAVRVAAMAKQEQAMLRSLVLNEDEVLEDVLVSASGTWHILKTFNNQSHYVYLVIPSSEANLVIVRSILLDALVTLIR